MIELNGNIAKPSQALYDHPIYNPKYIIPYGEGVGGALKSWIRVAIRWACLGSCWCHTFLATPIGGTPVGSLMGDSQRGCLDDNPNGYPPERNSMGTRLGIPMGGPHGESPWGTSAGISPSRVPFAISMVSTHRQTPWKIITGDPCVNVQK